ncbi:MAG: hypothetical protein R3B70_20560 [Polyangiaceae bacterium]
MIRSVLDVVSDEEAELLRRWEELDRSKEDLDKAAEEASIRARDRRRRLAERLSLSRSAMEDGALFVQAAAAEVATRRREAESAQAKVAELREGVVAAEGAKDEAVREHAELLGELRALRREEARREQAEAKAQAGGAGGQGVSGERGREIGGEVGREAACRGER